MEMTGGMAMAMAKRKRKFGVAAARKLVAYLEKACGYNGAKCDHTLMRTTTWMRAGGYDVDAGTQYLTTRGGFCDCEVVWNVFGQYYARRGLPLSKCKPANPWCRKCRCAHKNGRVCK